jgi:signal transduction histidine kinase
VQFEPSNIEESLTVQIVNTVYRVVQEELTNVARHARATMVTIELKVERSTIQLFIGDDGIGFDPGALPASASVGIIGMQERINLLGGAMQIQSEPGAGTRLFAKIPCQIEDKEEE